MIDVKINRIILISVIVILVGIIMYFTFLTHKRINNKTELTDLLGMDFTDVKITEIQYQNGKDDVGDYTRISVFLEESNEALQSRDYYYNDTLEGWPDLKDIPPGHIEEMEKLGIGINDIKKYGWNFKEIRLWWQTRPYSIYWYELNESHNHKGNVLLLTSISYKIVINVDKIMQE